MRASKILMVRPADFGFNIETYVDNRFQSNILEPNINQTAINEFDNFINTLIANKINVIVVQDTETPHTPDSIFPNNCFATFDSKDLAIFPMRAKNRRQERKDFIIDTILKESSISNIIDLTHYEEDELFLEGTGSMVLDRDNKHVFACRSPRTNESVLKDFCNMLGYSYTLFDAFIKDLIPIYHTNMMMSIGSRFAIVCGDCIQDKFTKGILFQRLREFNKSIIEISIPQLYHYSANVIEITDTNGDPVIIMSDTAYFSYNRQQLSQLKQYGKLLHVPIPTIEKVGGGSARCMIAELY